MWGMARRLRVWYPDAILETPWKVITPMRESRPTKLLRTSLAFFFGLIPLVALTALSRSRAQTPKQVESNRDSKKRSPIEAGGPFSALLEPPPGGSDIRRQTTKEFEDMHKHVLEIYSAVEHDRLAGKPIDLEIVYTWSRRALRGSFGLSATRVIGSQPFGRSWSGLLGCGTPYTKDSLMAAKRQRRRERARSTPP